MENTTLHRVTQENAQIALIKARNDLDFYEARITELEQERGTSGFSGERVYVSGMIVGYTVAEQNIREIIRTLEG